jgi:hypothetical protein
MSRIEREREREGEGELPETELLLLIFLMGFTVQNAEMMTMLFV